MTFIRRHLFTLYVLFVITATLVLAILEAVPR